MDKLIRIANTYIAVNQIVSVRLAEIIGAKHDECMGEITILTTPGVEYSEKIYRDDSWKDGGVEKMRIHYEILLQDIERGLSE